MRAAEGEALVSYADVIETTVLAVEAIAVAILALGVAWVLARGALHRLKRRPWETVFVETRLGLGRVLLLGLEVLIAADIIVTVTLELTLVNVGSLGLLVLIRTFLSWAIEVETEGRWPWQASEVREAERRVLHDQARAGGELRDRD
jgi:uncharacterized membrane protein